MTPNPDLSTFVEDGLWWPDDYEPTSEVMSAPTRVGYRFAEKWRVGTGQKGQYHCDGPPRGMIPHREGIRTWWGYIPVPGRGKWWADGQIPFLDQVGGANREDAQAITVAGDYVYESSNTRRDVWDETGVRCINAVSYSLKRRFVDQWFDRSAMVSTLPLIPFAQDAVPMVMGNMDPLLIDSKRTADRRIRTDGQAPAVGVKMGTVFTLDNADDYIGTGKDLPEAMFAMVERLEQSGWMLVMSGVTGSGGIGLELPGIPQATVRAMTDMFEAIPPVWRKMVR